MSRVKKALGESESVRFRLLLEHYGRLQNGMKSSLTEDDARELGYSLSMFSRQRMTRVLRATSYGITIVKLAVAAHSVELEKLIGACRLLRALSTLKPLVECAKFAMEDRIRDSLKDSGFYVPAKSENEAHLPESYQEALAPAKTQIVKGKLKIDLKPIAKEIFKQYECSLHPHASAIGTLKGFEKFIRDARISTDAFIHQIEKYQGFIDETPTRLKDFVDLLTKDESPWIGIGPAPTPIQEIEDSTLADVHDQLTSLLEGKT